MLEKKIRLRARQLYDERGQAEGLALEDWAKAESEVLKSSILAPLWSVRHEVESDGRSDDSESTALHEAVPQSSGSQSMSS